ncbi:MAG: RNA-binding protein [Oscillospiraceae bacterium]|nr:RNA-binding protein [Oscillospiraceae bacterium]
MNEEEKYQRAHLAELSARSRARGVWTYSDFLSLHEQSLIPAGAAVRRIGGYEGAERVIAAFGSEEELGYSPEPPLNVVRVASVSARFDRGMGHRDVLGALMSLGIKRQCLGDILIGEHEAYVICLDSVARHICDQLTAVGRTTVSCSMVEAVPDILTPEPEERSVVVASARIDALVSAVFRMSRGEARTLFERELVFCDGRLIASPGFRPDPGSVISVRGRGRFRFEGESGRTKKDNAVVRCLVW